MFKNRDNKDMYIYGGVKRFKLQQDNLFIFKLGKEGEMKFLFQVERGEMNFLFQLNMQYRLLGL